MDWFKALVISTIAMMSSFVFANDSNQQYAAFSDARAEVLETIGRATQRVWLVTDYLTDGEICAALYMAQYRKIDVQVLLGRRLANQYMSRLKYLKDQNIPTFLKPDSFSENSKTVLLVDQNLVTLDITLDFLSKDRGINMSKISDPARIQNFKTDFAQAAQLRVEAALRPLPLVGKQGGKGRIYQPSPSMSNIPRGVTPRGPAAAIQQQMEPELPDSGSVYNYDRFKSAQAVAPSGVAKKLPRETIQQKMIKQNSKSANAKDTPSQDASRIKGD